METLSRAGDIIGAIAFSAAFLALVFTPSESDGRFTPVVKWTIVSILGVLLFLTGSDAVGQTHIGQLGELVEDQVANLQAVLALGAVYGMFAAQQYEDAVRAQRALAHSHELMMDIVDQAPTGILFLDDAGRIAFANETAKKVLDLAEDPETGVTTSSGWAADGPDAGPSGELPALVAYEPYDGRPVSVQWPDGRIVRLRASGRPLADAKDRLGGIVVTFKQT
jgi:PAS domain-containing protein